MIEPNTVKLDGKTYLANDEGKMIAFPTNKESCAAARALGGMSELVGSYPNCKWVVHLEYIDAGTPRPAPVVEPPPEDPEERRMRERAQDRKDLLKDVALVASWPFVYMALPVIVPAILIGEFYNWCRFGDAPKKKEPTFADRVADDLADPNLPRPFPTDPSHPMRNLKD